MNFRSSISCHLKGKRKYLTKSAYSVIVSVGKCFLISFDISRFLSNTDIWIIVIVAGAVSLYPLQMFVTMPGTVWPTAGAAVTTSVTRDDIGTSKIKTLDCVISCFSPSPTLMKNENCHQEPLSYLRDEDWDLNLPFHSSIQILLSMTDISVPIPSWF